MISDSILPDYLNNIEIDDKNNSNLETESNDMNESFDYSDDSIIDSIDSGELKIKLVP